MEKLAEIFRIVLPTQLLAVSLAELAEKLGYKGRATLYRIINGMTSERAVNGLYQKLREVIGVDEDSLECMAVTVQNAARLNQIIKSHLIQKDGYNVLKIVEAFVSRNFDMFTDSFKDNELNSLMNLERTDPDSFYNMLAYFYYKHSNAEYYIKGEQHRERCARVLESLGEKFISLYPENDLAANFVYLYSKSEVFNGEYPILWSLIQSIATLLQFYSRPVETLQTESEIHFLPSLHNRDYWKGIDNQYIIITHAVTNINNDSGHYNVYKVDKSSRMIYYTGSLQFMSQDIVLFHSAVTHASQLGLYCLDENTLNFEWEKSDDNPLETGNTWTRLDLRSSEKLRTLDCWINDDRLYAEKIKASGLKEIIGHKVVDVSISREKLKLTLQNGNTLSISITAASFLNKIKPDDLVQIYERETDNAQFVVWPKIMHCLPLEYFTNSSTGN